MADIYVSAERDIAAPTRDVYGWLADYVRHHPRFLPPQFAAFYVEEGGVGAGTVFRFRFTAGGRSRVDVMDVTEPEPGRVLMETARASGLVTTFTVTPEGAGSRVRIDTRWQSMGGIGGFFERTLAPRVLTSVYADELNRLDQYARSQGAVY